LFCGSISKKQADIKAVKQYDDFNKTQKINSDFDKLKTIEEILDDVPILNAPILDFISWSSNYYHHPIGEVLSTGQ
jgi:primosomal protein N'